MELNRDMMRKAYPAMPQFVQEDISRTLRSIQLQEKNAPKRYARRLSFAGALVMVLIAAMLTAAIAVGARFGIFDFMSRILGESGVLPQASELVQTHLGSLDLPHTLITADEALYDGGSLQVVYSIQAKNLSAPPAKADFYNPAEGMDDPDSELSRALAADVIYASSGFDWFFINGEEHVMTNGSFGDAEFDEESGKIYCYMNLQLASSGIVPQGDFTVALPVAGALGDKKLLEFTVKEGITEGPKPMLETAQETVTVQSVFFTPVRAYANLRVMIEEGVPREEADNLLEDWRDAVLADKGGNEIAHPVEVYPGSIEEGKASDYHYTFLPADLTEAYLAPTTIDKNGNWVVDMSRALQVK